MNGLRQDRLDGDLLDVRQHPNHDVTRALKQTQDRWFLIRQGAAPTFTFQAAPPTLTAQLRDNFRVALMPSHDVDFIGFNFAAQAGRLFLTTTPSRKCAAMPCTVSASTSNSAAICSLDKLSPMKYKHNTHTRKG